MKLPKIKQCDVFVIGAGLAGIRAAIEIDNASVMLSSSTNIFSGSSFYPGTWGLGLIGPEHEDDKKDLKESIQSVGCGMCDDALVDVFVENIPHGIEELKQMGVKLKQAQDANQKEFIPCFDHKQRNWNGLLFQSLKDVFSKKLKEKKVTLLEHHEVIDIILNDEKAVCGVVVIDTNKQLQYIGCKSIIIATGGYGGIYKYRLNTNDICGMGQYLAFKSGAQLVNMEFMQMMVGFISPSYKTIFNEKLFQYTSFYTKQTQLFTQPEIKEVLPLRSTYGPFTSRLPSRVIDMELYKNFKKDESGILARYDASLKDTKIEFIQTYMTWMKEEKHLTVDDDIHLGMFAHAANGGIHIDTKAATGVAGLFACGEVTGGMHGADRIGGLSSANGLVFGKIAGHSAQVYANHTNVHTFDEIDVSNHTIKDAKLYLQKIQQWMFDVAMVIRNEQSMQKALHQIMNVEKHLVYEVNNHNSYADTYHLLAALQLSKVILEAAMQRKESRGSHYRDDYPTQNKAFQKPYYIQKRTNKNYPKEE